MSSAAQVRAALVAKLASLPNMGVVHAYERYAREEGVFRKLFVVEVADAAGEVTEQLRGWWLRRAATTERTLAIGRRLQTHTWQIRGYMALADEAASELVFDGLVDALADALWADPTLGGVAEQGPLHEGGDGQDGLQVLRLEPVLFCGVLCHSALCEWKSWSYT